jgi:hypothetical protein
MFKHIDPTIIHNGNFDTLKRAFKLSQLLDIEHFTPDPNGLFVAWTDTGKAWCELMFGTPTPTPEQVIDYYKNQPRRVYVLDLDNYTRLPDTDDPHRLLDAMLRLQRERFGVDYTEQLSYPVLLRNFRHLLHEFPVEDVRAAISRALGVADHAFSTKFLRDLLT